MSKPKRRSLDSILKAMTANGAKIVCIEETADGKLTVFAGKPGASVTDDDLTPEDELEKWRRRGKHAG